MKKTLILVSFVLCGSFALSFANTAYAEPTVRRAEGTNPAAIQFAVDQFRADLGLNNNTGGSFTSGRREINWDNVPNSEADFFPPNFFNTTVPRGVVLNNAFNFREALIFGSELFSVSQGEVNPVNLRFGNVNRSYANTFQTFSSERLFAPRLTTRVEVVFFIPGTKIPATVNGFGAVFTDVDLDQIGFNHTRMFFYDASGKIIKIDGPSPANNGLSFLGIKFNDGERIARVVIEVGNTFMFTDKVDGVNGVDVVALDDFIYGEPRAMEHHANDFDGDGTGDFAVFRPTSGNWFVLNSGNNTFQAAQFGQNGDIPVDGDFDGDSRSDFTVYRPSAGSWFIQNSSNNQFRAVQFGAESDKPVAKDYDKDGKTDIAVWRQSTGSYHFLRSSNGQFGSVTWGQNGDIPIGSALVP